MTLREAAQALAEEMETDVAAYRFQASKGDPPPSRALVDAIEEYVARTRAALAAPEPDRWTAGAEARAQKIEDALRLVSRFREECHAHDDDMGHPRRPFDDAEEWARVEALAADALAALHAPEVKP